MTVRASRDTTGTIQASAARTEADAALIRWHKGGATPHSVVPLLARSAETAADFSNLGAVLRAAGEPIRAEAAYRQAITLDPGFAAAHYNLGNLLLDGGHPRYAEESFEDAVRIRPDYAEAWNGIGLARQRQGALTAAAEAFAQAVRLAPTWPEAHVNHGLALFSLERYGPARDAYQAALALAPDHAGAHGNLGALLLRAGHPIAAEAASRRTIALAPGEHRWHANLAVALQMQARHQEAETAYRNALAIRPDYAGGHGNLLFALNYREDLPAEAIFAEYQRWDATHARPLRDRKMQDAARDAAPPLPNRRLRVGYVSPDFRQHAVALFAEPLLAAHDHARVELFLYAELAVEDETTARFRALGDHWRPTLGKDDATVARMIRDDGIDVLVDLGGHTAGSRLMVFARKPAPVQVAYLLGHGATSGLSAMDVFLADDALVPPSGEALFAERIVRLDRIPIVYRAPAAMPPPTTAVPARAVTFGHFGRTDRLNERVIAAWARILHAEPGSRLILDNRPFQEPAFRDLFTARFAAHGIGAERLTLRYTTPQEALWTAYGDIDIALDPFPHNAGTTTIEALWMGVPVVTLADRPSVGRFGAAILGALGLDDWVTHTTDDYVARAQAAARDRDGLAHLRASLRPRFMASSLYDAPGLARRLEDLFQDLATAAPPLSRTASAEDDAAAAPRSPGPTSVPPGFSRGCCPGFSAGVPPASHARLRALFQSGDPGAGTLAAEILAMHPADGLAAHVAGLLAYQQGRWAEADRWLRVALAQAPEDAEAHANHAAILRKLGRLPEAEQAARSALALAPDRAETRNNLGNILRDAGRFEEAAACFQDAVRAQPGFADAWANLAWVQSLCGQALESERSARRAIAADAGNANGHNNLGLALMRQSRLREAEDALRQALRLKPDFTLAHSNVLFCLNYRDDWSAEEIFAEYQRWDDRHARALAPARPAYALDRTPGRRLRVGYVSPDFRQHAVALFAEPLLAEHDRSQVELFCYAELAVGDATTERFRAMADHWRPTIGMDDAAVAELIRADRIDVLIDLAGHTAGNRLLAFARRPAPVQIEFMLGHGYTSGLSAMDAFLADDALAPPGSDGLFSERVVRLARIPLAYLPPAGMPPVAPAPVLRNGFVTFGYFGRTVRLNEQVIATWARILHAIPTARLMLNNGPFAEAEGRRLMQARFAAHGIAADRLILTCTTPQPLTWAAYGEIDLALDPFPHNAGTTTIEALWQGVPVISLAARPMVGRFGASILRAVGLSDWVAADLDAYVGRAVRAAEDPAGLAAVRADLRPRFAASPLHDAPGLARAIEAAYRTLWEEWREGDAPRLRRLFTTGQTAEAGALADRLLARDPAAADALHIKGLLAFQAGDAARAAGLLGQAPARADILTDRGVILRALRRPDDAEAAYRQALAVQPDFAPALGNLGNLLLDRGEAEAAGTLFTRAIAHLPDQPWLLRGKALALLARERPVEAEALLRQALLHAPADAEAHETLGVLLSQTGRPIEAEQHHRAALPRLRERHRGLANLAVALQTQGRHAEAEACYRDALAVKPDYPSGHGNMLFALNYRHDLTAEAIFAEYRRWDALHARTLAPIRRAPAAPDPRRRLRVGYVSPDFRQHAVAHFALPLLAAHDRSVVEVFCYAEVAVPDATTARFQAVADHWRSTVGMTDAAVADLIRADGIDVLVDMAGHTGGNRLLAFARRPAPVQIESLLGLGTTTGMAAMDGFLADDRLAPPGTEAVFAERLIRLPRIPLVYDPPAGMPEVAPLPALAAGHVTFGYFGRVQRLNERVLAAWARILRAVPGARLVLNSQPFAEAAFRAMYETRFAEHGIGAERLSLVNTTPQPVTWAAYGAIDIALDPFPHNAGTTTIEALWLGVPVVTRADRPTVGRFGAAILGCVGLDDWVTADDDAYVARAITAANHPSGLAALRASLRDRVATSPLRDAPGLARAMETMFRQQHLAHAPPHRGNAPGGPRFPARQRPRCPEPQGPWNPQGRGDPQGGDPQGGGPGTSHALSP